MSDYGAGRSGVRISPRGVLGVLALAVFIAALVAPLSEEASGPELSSYVAHPGGSRGLYDALSRLGFRVSRSTGPMRDELDARVVYLVLAPQIEPTAVEVHRLLDAVRAGAGLLVLPSADSRLADSLGMRRVPVVPLPPREPGQQTVPDTPVTFGRSLVSWVLRPLDGPNDSVRALVTPRGGRSFLSLRTRYGSEPVILGYPFGGGRIVAVANADLLTNRVLREGLPAVRVVRLIEWLQGDDPARTIVFDEYHHGYGTHASAMRVARRALLHTPAGRVAMQLAAAAIILLMAVAGRPVRPRPRTRIERRSPLEHVTALARAYREVGAIDRATRLLVRGLRRRHGGLRSDLDDVAYLRGLADRDSALAPDVDRLIDELEGRPAARSRENVAAAILHIERVIST